jgi:serine/threonine-protein kinase
MKPRPDTGDVRDPTPGAPRSIDRYEIVSIIGRGASGAVYRAIDTRLGRTVALKTATGSRDGARLTDRVRQRFLREAMALSKVDQRNVVQVLDYGFADDGTPFLVMEHLRGRDLAALLSTAQRPLSVPEVADIGLGVCAALRACHRVGIIHRDLKPANVFLVDTETGLDVKVLDFSVANAALSDDRTREALIVPASHHLAPEQIDGKVGPASDQYAVGVLLHFCLTRRFPDRARAIRVASARDDLPADLPVALDTILRRATRVSPSDRFESVYALGRELLEFASPRGQAQWRAYYRPESQPPPLWAALSPTQRQIGPAARTTSRDGARLATSTKVSRHLGRDGAAAGGRPLMAGPWPLRAATVGCVALAATGLAASRRRPPKPAPPAAVRREIAPPLRHSPGDRLPAEKSSMPARGRAPAPAVVTVTTSMTSPALPREPPSPPAVPSPPRRHDKSQAPSAAFLPNIDGAGIGIPAE